MIEITWTPEFDESFDSFDHDREDLRFDSIDEYMDDHLRNDVIESVAQLVKEDASVTVYGYRRMVPKRDECKFLSRLLEDLDEERGDPGKDHRSVDYAGMVALRELESEFIDKLLSVYKPWACEKAARIRVPVKAWLATQSEDYQREMLGEDDE